MEIRAEISPVYTLQILCLFMFIIAQYTIDRECQYLRYPSTDEWVFKRMHIYTMGYYSARRNKDVLESGCK